MDTNAVFAEATQLKMLHRYPEALKAFRQAAQGFREQNCAGLFLCSLCYQGQVLAAMGRCEEAESLLREAVSFAERLNDSLCMSLAHVVLGKILCDKGDFQIADTLAVRALDEATKADSASNRADALSLITETRRQQGRLIEAEAFARQTINEAETCGNASQRGFALLSLSHILFSLGRFEEAEAVLQQAALIAKSIKDRSLTCNTYWSLANSLTLRGRPDEAENWAHLAVDAATTLSDPLARCNAFSVLARVKYYQGNYCQAIQWMRLATKELVAITNPMTRCTTYQFLGRALQTAGRLDEARDALVLALAESKAVSAAQRATVLTNLGTLAMASSQFELAQQRYIAAQKDFLASLAENPSPAGISTMMSLYRSAFDGGLLASEVLFARNLDGAQLLRALQCADVAKCISVGVGLRRHGQRGAGPQHSARWRSGPKRLSCAFAKPYMDRARPGGPRSRGVRGTSAPTSIAPALALPSAPEAAQDESTQPVSEQDIFTLLPDERTLLIVFSFVGSTLYIMPLRRASSGALSHVCGSKGHLCCGNVLPGLQDLEHQLQGHVYAANEWLLDHAASVHRRRGRWEANALSAAELTRTLGDPPTVELFSKLHQQVPLMRLLETVEPDAAKRKALHLVLVPDGPLYGLPLHAACDGVGGPRLYQEVASVRYALSLRTLNLQHRTVTKGCYHESGGQRLRGVAFANPDRVGCVGYLPFAEREASLLIEETSRENWRVFGDADWRDASSYAAVRHNFRQWHGAGNLLWFIGHGAMMEDGVKATDGRTISVCGPSLLLRDGPVGMSRLVTEGYDFSRVRLVHFSSCLLGRLEDEGRSRQTEGVIATLTMLGCRRICSAMWNLSDFAACEFGRYWLRALRKHVFGGTPSGPHSFAIAFKDALESFRTADNGCFDHEFYWAPYTLYGLG